jgi:TetR/AcrR family transcriptional repressor of nem operon
VAAKIARRSPIPDAHRVAPAETDSRDARLATIPTGWYRSGVERHAPVKPRAGVVGSRKLLGSAMSLIRAKGYAATSVDDLCTEAGVTKGAFFHHFKSKGALAVAATEYWSEKNGAFFANAPYHKHKNPLDRVLGYIDFRKALLTGKIPEFTCLVGAMVQEVYETRPAIRQACNASISAHAARVEADLAEAIKRYRIRANCTPRSLALHTQAVLQGAFILAKAKGDATVAGESLDHLHRYIKLLFNNKRKGSTK